MSIPSIKEATVKNKTVLVRFDYNVPLQKGIIGDDNRLHASLPTLKYLLDHHARIIILSHLGRPQGVTPDLSLKPIVQALEKILNKPIGFSAHVDKTSVEQAWASRPGASILCLENMRFWKGEEENDPFFCQQLAALGDLYVNDAFSVSHRAHASVEGITHWRPSYGGLHLCQELRALEASFTYPQLPTAAIIGGSKVSTKFKVLTYLMDHMDHLFIAGGMANTFLKAQGYEVGRSFYEPHFVQKAQQIMAHASSQKCTLHLPLDVVVAPSLDGPVAMVKSVPVNEINLQEGAFDMGPLTLSRMKEVINGCRTAIWNGPLGVFERAPFHTGSVALAHLLAEKTRQGLLYTLAGGGETVAVLNQAQVLKDFSHVSTAGGAFLEFMEGQPLPGLQALSRRHYGSL